MLNIATQSVAACAVTVTLPPEVRYSKYYRNYGFYRFCGNTSSDEVEDLGFAPKTGEMDRLGNRPVIHSNVVGAVHYGTTTRIHTGEPGSNEVVLYIPNSINKDIASAYYCAAAPMVVSETATLVPRFDKRFASCRITCTISGSPESINVTVKVDVGAYTDPKTGKRERSVNGHVSVVLTRDRRKVVDVASPCGRESNTRSKMLVTVKGAFPKSVNNHGSAYATQLIYGFTPSIGRVQLAHSLLVARRITIGDSKAISDAFESIRLASFNGLAFTRDTTKLVRDTSRLVRDLRAVRKDPRRIASIWLSYRYGHRLYYQDCKSLMRGLSTVGRAKPLKFRGRHIETISLFPGTTTRVEYNFTLYCSPFCLADTSLETQLRSLDFWPSAENLWDLLPYSFLADWFIDVSDICKRYDMRSDILRYPILGAVQSVKCTTTSTVNISSGSGSAVITYYVRMPLTPAKLSTTLLSMNLSLMTGISLVHAADAFALAVLKRGR